MRRSWSMRRVSLAVALGLGLLPLAVPASAACITPSTCVAVGSSFSTFPSGATLVEVSSG